MWRVRSGFQKNGWVTDEEGPRRERKSDRAVSSWDSRLHSSRRKRLKARRARISACQSCIATPWASASLDAGRHFMPVLHDVVLSQGSIWGINRSSDLRQSYASLKFRALKFDILILVFHTAHISSLRKGANRMDIYIYIPLTTMPLSGTHS